MIFCIKEEEKADFSEDTNKQFHWLFYYRINKAEAGKYRHVKVFLTGSKYPLPVPAAVPNLMREFVEYMLKLKDEVHPVVFAAIAHKELVFIHPFIDGNSRVARLLMNLLLLQKGYTIAIIPPIMRPEYMRTLENAHDDDTAFIEFIANMVKESQKDYLRLFG